MSDAGLEKHEIHINVVSERYLCIVLHCLTHAEYLFSAGSFPVIEDIES